MMKQKTENLLCCLLVCGISISALIGLLYSVGGNSFFVENIYGQQVELYGDGIYAYNSVLTVSSRLGADINGLFGAVVLIALCLWKKKPLWAEVCKTAQVVYFTYHSVCLVFSISMNALFFLYVFCFGLSVILSVSMLIKHFTKIGIIDTVNDKKARGTSTFLIVSGILTATIWLMHVFPAILNHDYGDLLGVLTTESTYVIDLGIICPLLILCGIWVNRKMEVGYKLTPILLYILINVVPMVIWQNIFCIKFGIEVPIQGFISLVLSFVIMGIIAVALFVKTTKKLTYKYDC